MAARFAIIWDPVARVARVEGEVAASDGAALALALGSAPGSDGPVHLDLEGLELVDGVAVAEAVNGLRVLLARCGRLTLLGAPQMLAHTLYKVGMLQDGALVVEQPKEEEPTTAN